MMMSRKPINKAFVNSFKGGGGFGSTASGVEGKDLPYALLKAARQSGQLNLSNRSLTAIPDNVWKINVDIPEEAKNVSLANNDERWWDQVDLRKLIMASNQLTEIADGLKYLPALTVIDAHDNHISRITEEIGTLKELVKIHLSHNQLIDLPKSICDIASLKTLLLASNNIENLPEDIGYLCNIEELDLMGNKLKSLPESIGNMRVLKKLNLSKNEIESLPVGFENLTQLRDLDLSSNKLEKLPAGFGKLSSLEILECRYNLIKTFSSFTDVAKMKQLFLGYNRIKEINADVFEKLPYLVSLDLRDNAISSVPESLLYLKCLERIDLSNNCLSGLPYVIGNMPLKSLTLDGNPLRSIRRDIVARGTQAVLSHLRSRIPVEKREEPNSEPKDCVQTNKINDEKEIKSSDKSVDVREPSKQVVDQYIIATTKVLNHSAGSNNIPGSIWLVGAQISKINFSKNTLIKFPEEIGQYSRTLSELDLSRNKIQSITAVVGSLTKLTFLDLSNNLLKSLPDEIINLVHLLQIYISFNQFDKIPAILFKLPKLQAILLANNSITEIDVEGLLLLKTLQTLDLSNNNISRVPPQLGNVEWLRSLTLDGNSFRNPRPQIMTKGTQSILEYLRDRIPK